MTYVVAYDISDDRIRDRMAEALAGFGQRVQESVFECQLDPGDVPALRRVVVETLERPEHGNVRIYRVCADCHAASFGIGAVVVTFGSGPCLVA